MAKPKKRFEWAKRPDGKRERWELKSEIALGIVTKEEAKNIVHNPALGTVKECTGGRSDAFDRYNSCVWTKILGDDHGIIKEFFPSNKDDVKNFLCGAKACFDFPFRNNISFRKCVASNYSF